MLTLTSSRNGTHCDGASRRDFLKIGALGLGGFALPDLLRARESAVKAGQPTKNTSVVWLWLGGGPTHVETFDPKPEAPAEYRSVTGSVKSRLPGVELGGNFEKMANQVTSRHQHRGNALERNPTFALHPEHLPVPHAVT